jgi:hypothetical protein
MIMFINSFPDLGWISFMAGINASCYALKPGELPDHLGQQV